jgi:tRNA (cmo5U34)-methyltransferase
MKIPTDWTFKTADVAEAFEAHVREQLPWYDLVTGAVAHIIRHYLPHGGLVYDIGASTGNVGLSIADVLLSRKASLIAVEASPDMAKLYRGPGRLIVDDACKVDYAPFDVGVLFLVLMFLTPAERRTLLRTLAAKIKPGGCIVLLDKLLPPPGWAGTIYRRLTLAGKVATNTPASDIVAKELSLSGLQRPLDHREVPPAALEFFRFGEFAGWIIEGPALLAYTAEGEAV